MFIYIFEKFHYNIAKRSQAKRKMRKSQFPKNYRKKASKPQVKAQETLINDQKSQKLGQNWSKKSRNWTFWPY